MSDLPEEEKLASGANPDRDPGDDGPRIAPSDEMERALREATEAFEEREAGASKAAATPDKMTIELLSSELQDLKRLHEEKIQESQEQGEQFLRLQAEFDNFRRRSL